MPDFLRVIIARLKLSHLAATNLAGKYYPLMLLVAPLWLLVTWFLDMAGLIYVIDVDVQNYIVALPMVVIASILGVRTIAGEISGRTLEIIYTVPGGVQRVWWSKLIAAFCILFLLEAILSLGAWLIFTSYPILMLQGAMQAALFYLALSMALAALFRSEVGGGICLVLVLGLNFFVTQASGGQFYFSPFYNPWIADLTSEEFIAHFLQNRIGVLLVTLGIIALAFMRSNRREKLLNV